MDLKKKSSDIVALANWNRTAVFNSQQKQLQIMIQNLN